MKRQAALIASAILAFALVAVLIAADKIPIGVVTVVNGTGGGNLTVSGTGGTDQLLTWDTDTTGHWTSGISAFGVTNLSVLSSMSINITNQVLSTDGSGNVVPIAFGNADGFVYSSPLSDFASITNVFGAAGNNVMFILGPNNTSHRGSVFFGSSQFPGSTEFSGLKFAYNDSNTNAILTTHSIAAWGMNLNSEVKTTISNNASDDTQNAALVEIISGSGSSAISSLANNLGSKMEMKDTSGNDTFSVDYDGSTYSVSTNFSSYVYVTNDCSALTFTDRSRSPSSLADAYRIVKSHATKNGQVDHDKLDKLAQGKTKDTRDLGMVISAQEMVIQDLLTRIEKLEKK